MSVRMLGLARGMLVVAMGAVLTAAPTAYPDAGVPASEPAPDGGVVHTLTRDGRGWGPSSVVDDRGNTTVVWAQGGWRGAVRAVRRPAGGVWGPPVLIGRGIFPVAAADAVGNVTVVFETGRRGRTVGLSAVRRPVNGGWQEPVPLSRTVSADYDPDDGNEGTFGAQDVDLAVNARGDAIVMWTWGSYDRGRPYRIQSAFRRAGGRWNPPIQLTGRDWSEDVSVAIGPGGNATAVYTSNSETARERTVSRRRVFGEGWRPPVPVLGRRVDVYDRDVVVDERGTATFTFTGSRRDVGAVMTTRRAAGRIAWPRPRRISPRDIDIGSSSQVLHPSGAISVAMQRRAGRIDVVRRPPGGPWRPRVQVSPDARWAEPPVVATNATEVLFVLWRNESLGLRGRIRYPDGDWTPTFQVSPGPGYFTDYEASAYPNGDTLAVWQRDSAVKARRMLR